MQRRLGLAAKLVATAQRICRNYLPHACLLISLILALTACRSSMFLAPESTEQSWVRGWGGAEADVGQALALDPASGLYLAGTTASVGAGNLDALLLSYDADGALSWRASFGGTGADGALAVTADANAIYVAGSTASFSQQGLSEYAELLLLSYNSAGTLNWRRTWAPVWLDVSPCQYCEALAAAGDGAGGVYLAGYATGQTLPAPGSSALYWHYRPDGQLLGADYWQAAASTVARAITLDDDHGLWLAGELLAESGAADVFVLGLDLSGSVQLAAGWGGAEWEQARALAWNSTGLYVAGLTESPGQGGFDALILKLGSSGQLQWARSWGAAGVDELSGLAPAADGTIYAVGRTSSFNTVGHDILVLRFDAEGELLGAWRWEGNELDDARAATIGSGALMIAGSGPATAGQWWPINGVWEILEAQLTTLSGSLQPATGLEGAPEGVSEWGAAGEQLGGGGADVCVQRRSLLSF